MVAMFTAPFLLAVFLEIALSLTLMETLRQGGPGQYYVTLRPWLSLALWGASMAMVYVALLRWVVHGEVRHGPIQLDFSRATLLAMPVVVVWFLVDALLQQAPAQIYAMLSSAQQFSVFETQEYLSALYAFHAVAWLIRLGVSFLCFGMLAIIVQHDRFTLAEYFHLLDLQPARVFLVVILAWVLLGGMRLIYVNAADFAGVSEYAVPREIGLIWTRQDALAELLNVPSLLIFNFLSFLFQMPPIAEAYGWVLGQKRRVPAEVAATFT